VIGKEFRYKNGLRFVISFGIDKSSWVQDFTLFGVRWTAWADNYDRWIEVYFLGFRFYFDFAGIYVK
jgi:hypothetical protein